MSLCVGLLGATGETGTSILDALLDDGSFDVIALVRPASRSKPRVPQRTLDLTGDADALAAALAGIDILISAIGPRDQLAQLPLAVAAKRAGVRRFMPCGFAPVMPVGVHQSRDQKEEVYNLVKRLHLPYTIIDVGWWYQFSLPRLASGKLDYVTVLPYQVVGDGNVPSALTDLRDVGKYVVRAIKDERTLNAMVFVYNEMWTANEVFDAVERIAEEKTEREFTTVEAYEARVRDAMAKLEQNPTDFVARAQKVAAQYALSINRGENTPQFAKYLGYLDGKVLYPDVAFTPFETYLHEVVEGRGRGVYDELKHLMK